jgi:hypothetical protein
MVGGPISLPFVQWILRLASNLIITDLDRSLSGTNERPISATVAKCMRVAPLKGVGGVGDSVDAL